MSLLPEEKEKMLARMRIPRKPQWSNKDSRDEYLQRENVAFLDWRRKLAEVEESELHLKLTPFERNVEVWKQLWRVVDRSHILIQIVDVRDILFYRCEDLERYVSEVDPNKIVLLLINKSDLASEEIRTQWTNYLNNNHVNFIFFSAKIAKGHITVTLGDNGIGIPESANETAKPLAAIQDADLSPQVHEAIRCRCAGQPDPALHERTDLPEIFKSL